MVKWFNKNKKAVLEKNVEEHSEELTLAEKKTINERTKQHFAQKQKFEKDRTDFNALKAKIGLTIGGIGTAVGLAGVLAVAFLTPLKTTEPFVIRVDNNTGHTDIVKPISNAEQTTYGEELDKYWLAKFVLERESYDWDLIKNSYSTVELMTTTNLFNEYKAYITSPVSPVNLFKQTKKIKVQVLSVAFVNGLGQVRFLKQVLSANGDVDATIPATYWLATIAFDYKHKIKLEQQRMINPLGFQAISYRVDSENLIKKSDQ